MITLKDYMELIDYRITEGSTYCWQCYGPNAHAIDSWNQEHDGFNVSIVFDTVNHVVYEATVCDYRLNTAYRIVNPLFKEAFEEEILLREEYANEAWDEVYYIDLEVDDDFIQKTLAIVAREDYDTRVKIELDLEENVMFFLMKKAHEQDITLNALIENVLLAEISLRKSNFTHN